MNLGLVTSFIVGGMLMLSIIFFNVTLQNQTVENTLATTTNAKMDELVEILSNDFNRMGYQYTSTIITKMASDEIIFWGDIYDSDSFNATQVSWEWTTSSLNRVPSTNPNDYYLNRVGPTDNSTNNGEIQFPVSYFNIVYRNAIGAITTQSGNVREIEVEIMMESGEPYSLNAKASGQQQYYRTVWKRSFYPTNLNKSYY